MNFKPGDMMTIEATVSLGGTQSKSSYCFVAGKANEKQKEAYKVLVEAFQGCIREARPGVTLSHIENTARNIIDSRGYGKYGYWNHGEPFFYVLRQRYEPVPDPSRHVLREGMAFTIEPSIKVPFLNAYLLIMTDPPIVKEDMIKIGLPVVITRNGCEALGNLSLELSEELSITDDKAEDKKRGRFTGLFSKVFKR